jgi:hypothetical protein
MKKKFLPIFMTGVTLTCLILSQVMLCCTKEIKEDVNFFVYGGPEICYWYSVSLDSFVFQSADIRLDLYTDQMFDILVVEVNGEIWENPQYLGYHILFQQSIPVEYIEYKLRIESDIGEALAVCRIPDRFKITMPTYYQIPVGADCEIVWQNADNAQSYVVVLYLDYLQPQGSVKDTSFSVEDTTITIDGNWLDWPGELGVQVSAINGANFEAGEEGNISGNAKGFWTAKSTIKRTIIVE